MRDDIEASAYVERAELAAHFITEEDAPRVFAFHYRCGWPGCPVAALFPDRLRVAPDLVDGEATCPGCGQPLQTLGERRATVEVKIAAEGAERVRIPVEQSEPVELGRRGGRGVFPLDGFIDAAVLSVLSRRHARLEVAADHTLVVTDLGSKNGTWVVAQPGASPQRLGSEPHVLAGHDAVYLANAVVLRRSGRRFPLAARPVAPRSTDTRDVGGVEATRFWSRPSGR